MRHQKKHTQPSKQKMKFSNMGKNLIQHKSIITTLQHAKALRSWIEPIINKAKTNSTHNRRQVFSHFQDKNTIKELFDNIAPKISHRPGGYTSIIRLNRRKGDNAQMAIIQLIDYNEHLLTRNATSKTQTPQPTIQST